MANKMVQCQFCSFTSKHYNRLRAHEKNEHYYISEKLSNKFENVKKKKNNGENVKHFTCKFCSYTSTRNYNVMRHIKRNHWRKNEENVNDNIKREKKKDVNIDEKLEEELYKKISTSRESERGREHMRISTYTRKNEIGKEALEVTRKFGVDVEKLFEIIRNSIDYRIRIEKLEKRFTEPLNETQRKEDRKDGNDIEKRIEKMDKRYTETIDEIQAQHEKNNL